MLATKRSQSEYRLKIAELQSKIQRAREAKEKVQQHIRALHQEYAQGRISYAVFDEKTKAFLKNRSLEAWLEYYDGCISTYEQHMKHYAQKLTRVEERRVNLKYLSIFLILALTLGVFLFVPYFQFTGIFPTGGVSTELRLNQSVYTTNAVLDHSIFGRSNATIVFYNATGGPDFMPVNTTINITLWNITRQLVNTSDMNLSHFILNSTSADCLNFTAGEFKDVNSTWVSEGQIGYGYGYNATIATTGSTCGFPNVYTVNLSKFFAPVFYAPGVVGFYNITLNISIADFVNVANVSTSFIVDNRAPNWNETRMNDSRPFVPNNISLEFNTTWDDDLNLNGFIFGMNNTGQVNGQRAFRNSTYTFFSLDLYDKRYNLSRNTTFINVPKGGTNVTWLYYANDSAGRMNVTDIQWFIVNTPPSVYGVNILPTGPRESADNMSANVTTTDADTDSVNVSYNWYRNNVSITVLNMPMTNAIYSVGWNTTFDFSRLNNFGNVYLVNFNRSLGKTGYNFNHQKANITIAHSASLNLTTLTGLTGNLTIESWVWANALGTVSNHSILVKGNTTDGYSLLFRRQIPQLVIGPDNSSAAGFPPILAGRWYHIVGVWNGTSCMVYVNATLYGGSQSCPSLPVTTFPLVIGNDADLHSATDGVWNGTIGDTKVYNITLTAEQIFANYYDGTGRYNLTVSSMIKEGEVWNVSATPIDEDGLNGTAIISTSVTIAAPPDLISPVVRLVSPLNATNTTASTISFNFSTSDAGSLVNATLFVDWQPPLYIFTYNNTNDTTLTNDYSITNNVTVINVPEGNWTWNVQVCDSGFNCAFNNTNYTITVDRSVPVVNNVYPLNNSVNNTHSFLNFYYNVSDFTSEILNCTLVVNNTQSTTAYAPITESTTNVNISRTLASGDYNWTVRCVDQVGLMGNSSYFNVSVRATTIACAISDAAFNVSFGDNVGQGQVLNATRNYLGYGVTNNYSWYNVSTSGSNVWVNITILGYDFLLLGGSRSIGIGNVSWNSTNASQLASNFSMVFPGKKNLSTTYDNEALGTDLQPGSVVWYRFWLNVPSATLAGSYTGNYTVRCAQAY